MSSLKRRLVQGPTGSEKTQGGVAQGKPRMATQGFVPEQCERCPHSNTTCLHHPDPCISLPKYREQLTARERTVFSHYPSQHGATCTHGQGGGSPAVFICSKHFQSFCTVFIFSMFSCSSEFIKGKKEQYFHKGFILDLRMTCGYK